MWDLVGMDQNYYAEATVTLEFILAKFASNHSKCMKYSPMSNGTERTSSL